MLLKAIVQKANTASYQALPWRGLERSSPECVPCRLPWLAV